MLTTQSVNYKIHWKWIEIKILKIKSISNQNYNSKKYFYYKSYPSQLFVHQATRQSLRGIFGLALEKYEIFTHNRKVEHRKKKRKTELYLNYRNIHKQDKNELKWIVYIMTRNKTIISY